jgi:hypothetical protein
MPTTFLVVLMFGFSFLSGIEREQEDAKEAAEEALVKQERLEDAR